MNVVTQLDEARQRHSEAVVKMEDWDAKYQSLPEDHTDEEQEFFRGAFGTAKREAKRWADQVERLEAISEARREIKKAGVEDKTEDKKPAGYVQVGDEETEKTYTRRNAGTRSFFFDLYNSTKGDGEAQQRLNRHTHEVAIERRDISTVVTAGGNFVPPQYLGDLWAELPRAGRPFADAVPTQPLMQTGMNLTIPKLTTGTAVAIQASDNAAVQETDIVEALLTVPVRTIAGQQDVSQQLFDRSEPGIDAIIFGDLRADYDMKLDTSLLNGAGTSGTHLGIRAVTSVNTVSYTDATPTAAEFVPGIYNAVQLVASTRFQPADTIVMHPRRAAWLASNLSSTFPLFQLGGLYQAAGTQDQGFVQNFAGLRVILDANTRTTDGASTNQDEVYVLRVQDSILWEGPLQARVHASIGSGTLTIRLQLFAYSAFAAGRQPKSIAVISGTGLTAPTF
jgi:HK97 family phage major capsid protein